MKKIFVIAFILPFVISSCKKDKLEGEYEILEGSWSLGYIVEFNYSEVYPTTFDTLFPASISNTYRLEFLPEGILKQYTDGQLVEKYRIAFESFTSANSAGYDFTALIKLDNKPTGKFLANVSQTKMSTSKGHISDDYQSQTNANGSYETAYEFIYFKD